MASFGSRGDMRAVRLGELVESFCCLQDQLDELQCALADRDFQLSVIQGMVACPAAWVEVEEQLKQMGIQFSR